MLKLLKNFSYTILSNLGNALVSTLVVFIIPKLISQHDYGMFQIFLFYFSYAGLIQFGWLDGIYLRYGGAYYHELDKGNLRGQFRLYTLFQLLVCIGIITYGMLTFSGLPLNLLILIILGILVTNEKSFFQFVLQLSNRISEFSFSTILSAVVYALFVAILLLIGIRNYHFFIWANILGQVCALIYGIWVCKDIFSSHDHVRYNFFEIKKNISAGVKISFSSIAGMLILGIVRLGVQTQWSVATFGKVSLVLSICNLLMLFINAASLVLFPVLRRLNNDNMLKIYRSISNILMPLMYLMLILYYPIELLISLWLPKYQGTLIFMAVLFPLGLYQGKFEVLSNTFFKVWRMETYLMIVNLIALIVSGIFTVFFSLCYKDLNLLILSIIFTLAIRSFCSDWILFKKKSIKLFFSFIEETIIVFIFILSNVFLIWYLSLCLYLVLLSVIWFFEREKIKISLINIKNVDYKTIE